MMRYNCLPYSVSTLVIGVAYLLILGAARVEAREHFNIEEGMPAEVEDAYPIAEHAREIQVLSRFIRTEDGSTALVVEPGLEMHFTPKWPFKIAVPFETEDIKKGLNRSNVAFVEVFHNLNAEFGLVPSFAISGRGSFPTASDSQGIDTSLKLIASKNLGGDRDRVHINLAWRRNGGREKDERRNSYLAVIGYSRVISLKTVLVTDYVREQELEKGKTAQFIELGLRQSLFPGTVLSLGMGAGLDKDSPDFRVTLGVQIGI